MSEFHVGGETEEDGDAADEKKKPLFPKVSPELAAARDEFEGFFQKFERLINGYSGTTDITFTVKPGGWYINLEKFRVNADPNFFIDRGYTRDEALFATFHELEHFLDMVRDQDAYTELFARFKAEIVVHPAYPRALNGFYNCIDDILVNRAVISRWNSGGVPRDSLYPKLFPRTDFSKHPRTGKPQPRFRQFMYTLLREAMLPDEPCTVSPEVRAAIDRVQATGGAKKIIDLVAGINIQGKALYPPKERFEVIQGIIEPVFRELFLKDAAEAKERKEKEKKHKGEKGEQGEGGDNENDESSSDGEPDFSDDPFADSNPDPINWDELNEEAKKINDAIAKKKADDMQKLLGVSKDDHDAYKKDYDVIAAQIEDLSHSFDEVITRRKTYKRKLKKSVKEGVMLSPARMATAVAEIKTGNTDPRVMLDYEDREQIRIQPAGFEFTVVCDGSGSIESNYKKKEMQRRLAVLIVEALNNFQERLNKERRNGQNINLQISTEARIFSDDDEVIKPLNTSLTHQERVTMHKRLNNLPNGNNNEPATFQAIYKEQFVPARVEKIQKGEIKKVILFLTDGETDAGAVQAQIKKMQKAVASKSGTESLVIAGIGFAEGHSAVQTYAPHGFYAKDFSEIVEIFKTFLREILDQL